MMIRVEHLLATSILGFIIICLIIYFDRSSKRKTGEADEFSCDSRNSNMIYYLRMLEVGQIYLFYYLFIFKKKKKMKRENQYTEQ